MIWRMGRYVRNLIKIANGLDANGVVGWKFVEGTAFEEANGEGDVHNFSSLLMLCVLSSLVYCCGGWCWLVCHSHSHSHSHSRSAQLSRWPRFVYNLFDPTILSSRLLECLKNSGLELDIPSSIIPTTDPLKFTSN